MLTEKVIFTEEECNKIISLANKFNTALFYKQPECVIYLNKDQRKDFQNKFECFGIKKFPRQIKILKYSEGIGFNLHKDSDGKDGRLKSIVTQLSHPSDYEGGVLKIVDNFEWYEVNKNIGNSVIYPSSALHEVSTITSGVRYVMVFWIKKWNLKLSKSII